MGAEQLNRDWNHLYQRSNQHQQTSTSLLLRHKRTQEKFELVPVSANDETQKLELGKRFKLRKAIQPSFVRHLQDIYFKEEEQLCGNMSKFQLIYEFVQCRLQQHFHYRKQKRLTFQDQEIFYLLFNISQALKEVQTLNDRHGHICMKTVLISREIKLQDPILIEAVQTDKFQSFRIKTSNYPSPNILLNRVDSGMNLDYYLEDLFSLGMLALQLCFPYEDIKKIYKSKNTRYQNQRIEFTLVYQYLHRLKNPLLRDCLNTLLSQIPNQRTKIYSLLRNVQISRENLFCITHESKPITHEQELANIFNPNTQSKQSVVKQINYPRPYFSEKKVYQNESQEYVKQLPNTKNINSPPFQSALPKTNQQANPKISIRFQNRPLVSYQPNTLVTSSKFHQYPIPAQKRLSFHYSQNIKNGAIPGNGNGQNFISQQHEISGQKPIIANSYNHEIANKNQETNKVIINKLNLSQQVITKQPKQDKQVEKGEKLQKSERKTPIQEKSAQKQKNEKETTPIKNLALLFSPFKQDLPIKAENKENQNKLSEQNDQTQPKSNNRRSPNKNLQALHQQFAQLQIIAKKNEQLQKKIHFEANSLFTQKQPNPIQQEIIVQGTFQDSVTDEPQLVLQEYQAGHKYEGYTQNRKRNGFGKFYYEGGSVYQGEWFNNKMCGYGMLFYPNGTLAYQGFWNNDEFDGKGTLKNDDFQQFDGNFDYTNFKGMKNYQWKIYDGEWHKDKKQGKGKLTLSNEEYYEGEFKNDVPHGTGVFRQLKGNKIKGIWVSGVLTSLIE